MRRALIVCAICVSQVLAACPDSDAPTGDGGSTTYRGDAGSVGKCLRTSKTVALQNIDQLDLLLMVDNSTSMTGEQLSLKQQFPALFKMLTTGYRFDGDTAPFPPVRDLHVGIVSSDMGIAGTDFPPRCKADGGDDGKLQNKPHGDNCDAQYPQWLSFIGDATLGPASDPAKFANDVGCIAMLGTGGCGFEQQLEAPFKALMPKILSDAAGNMIENPYRFLAVDEARSWGRGDLPAAEGGSLGFLRDSSLLAIVVVTDEEDCSVTTTEHLKPNSLLPPDSPYAKEDVNLRCFMHKEFLYSLEQRYLRGFRALRPGKESLVLFAAIAGIPTDLVDQSVISQLDLDDNAQRERFYKKVLGDPRMQERVDPSSVPGSGQGRLTPSCSRVVAGDDMPSTAYPPRRIVELARLFGSSGIVQSICQDDFGPALRAVVDRIATKLGEACLPRSLARKSNGFTSCEVIWELPAQAPLGEPTPTRCEQLPFLSPVSAGSANMNAGGGFNCKVQQLAVTDVKTQVPPPGDGWFYDDFTGDVARSCKPQARQRIAFTPNAKPPSGVTVKLECLTPVSEIDGDAGAGIVSCN